MPRLFISHSSKDNFEAIAFAEWLVREGWSEQDIFLDLHDIGAGARWKEALAKANERCEAVVLLASPASLASTECRLEIRMAEDYGKEIIVGILYLLTPDADELGFYRERQIVDLGMEPRDASFTVEHKGQRKAVAFSGRTLRHIKARLDQLGISPTSFSWRPGNIETASPYPGFEGFSRQEAGLFFGRAGDIARGLAELRRLRRLGTGQVMVIQAASGAGKSSFLKAGLWPRLERDPDFLPLAILRPATGILTGENGLGRQLAAFFATHRRNRTAADIHEIVRRSPAAAAEGLIALSNEATDIGHAVQRMARPDAPVPTPILAVDQAEELFAGADSEESLRFLGLVAQLLAPGRQEGEGQARLNAPPLFIWTIRADSLDELLHATDRAGIKAPQPLLLPPIPREAYREIIEAPLAIANQAGMRMSIDPLLVDALVDASTGADALPLLAFTLRQLLADHRSGATANLTLAQYEAAGGMEGILGKRLAAVQRSVGSSPEGLRRLLLPHLATWDEEAKPPAAKRLVANEAQLIGGGRADLKPLADALVEARLLTRSGSEGGEPTLEVAHEALLRQSPISDWLAEDREFLVWRDRLSRTRAQFDANARGLLVGRELQIAHGWLQVRAADVPAIDRGFIEVSVAEDHRRRTEEEQRERQRQVAELEASRRAVRRTAMGLVVALILAVLAGLAGVYAFSQQKVAETSAKTALKARNEALITQSRFLAKVAAQTTEEGDAATGVLLALEAMPDEQSLDDAARTRPYWAQAEASLSVAAYALRERLILKGHTGVIRAVAVTPDGARIVTGSEDNTARVWDAQTGADLLQLRGHTGPVFGVAVSPDGARIVTGSTDYTARVWDAQTGKELFQLKVPNRTVRAVAVTPDGARIVTGSTDYTARVWDAQTGKELFQIKDHIDGVHPVAVTPDARIVTGSKDRTVRVWDAKTGSQLFHLKDHIRSVEAAAVTPDGARIVTINLNERLAEVWDAQTGKELFQLKGHIDNVQAVAVTPDGARIVTGSADHTARVWDAQTGKELFQLKGHIGSVQAVAVTPDGARVVTGSEDNTARVWDAQPSKELFHLKVGLVNKLAVTPDGARIVTSSLDHTPRVWDARTGKELFQLKGHTEGIWAMVVSPDGARIVTGSDDKTARVWDAQSGKELLQLKGGVADAISAVAIAPDGTRIVTGLFISTVKVWDARTGKELFQLKGNQGLNPTAIVVTPDGARIATSSLAEQTVRVWDAQTGKELFQLKGHTKAIIAMAVWSDGARIVTGSADHTARVWDAQTGAELLQLKGHTYTVNSVAVTPDGARIVTGSADHTARVWDAQTGAELLQLKGHTDTVSGVAVTRVGGRIVTGSYDGTVRVWLLPPSGQALVEEAKKLVPRCLSPTQRQSTSLAPTAPRWCETMQKWPYDNVSIFAEGQRLVRKGNDDEAMAMFALALTRDPSAAKRIDMAWADAYVDRGNSLWDRGEDAEATAVFAKALARDPSAAKRIDEAWVRAYVRRGNAFVGYDAKRALDNYEKAIAKAREGGVGADVLAEALQGRGVSFVSLRRYHDAIVDFEEAARLGHALAPGWRWWAIHRSASQLMNEGRIVPALLTAAVNHFNLTPELRKEFGRKSFTRSLSEISYAIGHLHGAAHGASSTYVITDCDRLAGAPFDPLRVAPGVALDAIDAASAIAACDQAIVRFPNEPRYRYQRARAQNRSAKVAKAAGEERTAIERYAAAISDVEDAMAKGYPVGFNNMAIWLETGEGVAKDDEKGADFHLEAFNRVVHCCWLAVARHLMDRQGEHDAAQVRRVVHELLLWASALGSQPAAQMLTELYAKGTLAPPLNPPADEKATFTSLPPWLR